MATLRCPDGYRAPCECEVTDTEPRERCPVHGTPDWRRCEFCGLFVAWGHDAVCKRCGWQRTWTLAWGLAGESP